ncbi:MAG: HD domain-containing phosphohydrolase, partial [Thermoleophilaceae bacterium]
DAACQAMGAASFSISRWERAGNVMRTLVNAGALGPGEERLPGDETYPLDEHPTVEHLLRTAMPYHNAIDDPDSDPHAVALLRKLHKESDIGVPIVVEGEVWGEVWVSTSPGAPRFRGSDVRFLEAIAGQLAGVVARGELFSRVSRLAYEDELTGLSNRRALDEQLGSAIERWREQETPLTLLVCDVDELKTINDERGHHAGDRALRRVGRALVKAAAPYPGACVARISGDEFAVVLAGAGMSAASDVAATALAVLDSERDLKVAMSCGAAAAGPGVERAEQLMRVADAAQYAAKRRGGGQLCTAGSDAFRTSLHAGGGEPAGPRRRGRRRGLAERLEDTSKRVLALLDRNLSEHPTVDRLEAVSAGFAEVVNAAAWTISFATHGESTIRSLASADDRDSRLRGIRVGLEQEVYALADFPLTERLVRAGSGSYVVDSHDRSADPAERRLLNDLDYSSVLGTAVSDVEGTYLIELYADGDTNDLTAANLTLSLLARAAAAHSNAAVEGVRQLRKRTRHLSLLGVLASRMASIESELGAVEATVEELHNELGHPLTSISRLTPEGQVEPVAARGELASYLFDSGWHSANVGLVGRCLRERSVVAVGDVAAEPDYRPLREARDVRSEMCAPLWCGDRLWGVIDVEDTRLDTFDSDDAHLLRSIADLVSAALRSAELRRHVESAYLDTAEAVAAALEANDSYSASHVHSIGTHAEAVGRDLGLGDEGLRDLRLGVAFHDVGKLAVSEAILCKREPLTAYERSQIEQHTVIGERILAPIELLAGVCPIVRHCHERWDGSGYPDRLAGDRIPLAARIVFACDSFDAMTTDRPYRAALSRSEALEELKRCAGTQFDPAVTQSLLRVLGAADPYGVLGST